MSRLSNVCACKEVVSEVRRALRPVRKSLHLCRVSVEPLIHYVCRSVNNFTSKALAIRAWLKLRFYQNLWLSFKDKALKKARLWWKQFYYAIAVAAMKKELQKLISFTPSSKQTNKQTKTKQKTNKQTKKPKKKRKEKPPPQKRKKAVNYLQWYFLSQPITKLCR